MAKERRPDGFDALVADHQQGQVYFEETDGSHRLWRDLSAEGKLSYIARDAALYDVPFERFQEAVRDVLGKLPSAMREEAALRLALRNERELHAIAKLLPPDRSGTESTSVVEQVKDALKDYEKWLALRPERVFAYLVHDSKEAMVEQLESFGDEFERLAKTKEQKKLAAAFQEFVGEITGAGRDAYRKMLAEAACAGAPEREKDKGIDR
jgi:hypothetical protein